MQSFRLATTLLILSSTPNTVCFSSSFRPVSNSPTFISGSEKGSRGTQTPRFFSKSSEASNTMTAADATMPSATAPADAASKLSALRSKMEELDLDVYLVPSDDPHLSEYTPEAYKRRGFLTDFHGSAGTAVVSKEQAFLWTDSRYFNEANLCLDGDYWSLMKSGLPKVPTIVEWLAEQASKHYEDHSQPLKIGIDPYIHPASFEKDLQEALEKKQQEDAEIGQLVTSHPNLVDIVWGESRPPLPASPFRAHPLEYAGTSVEQKVEAIRSQMQEKKATLSVFCTLDDVAYLLNVRAMGDIPTCPVGIAYATVGSDEITLYCDAAKIQTDKVKEHLKGVTCKPYDSIVDDLKAHVGASGQNKVWMDKSRANLALVSVVPPKQLIGDQNAVTPMKASKNDAELKGLRQAHIVDGAAMAEFISWLEVTLEERKVSEVEIDEKLTGQRAKQPGFLEVSFPTIAGVGSNGAIIHYSAKEGTDLLKYLDKSQPILIDSGGQYSYGTTDVTRTWFFGDEPPEEFMDAYTRVLKGNIGVDTMVFPENTPGFVLDVFARKSLWEAGLDYGHGTGHGVGAALNVHEGPMSISPRWNNKEFLKKGMVVSNEPGYYEDGNFGVRIENLLEIQYVNPQYNQDPKEEAPKGKKKFMKFNKLTMIPIQKNLIKMELMKPEELDWLDAYHNEVFEKISPLLEQGSPAMEWLEKSCSKIDRAS